MCDIPLLVTIALLINTPVGISLFVISVPVLKFNFTGCIISDLGGILTISVSNGFECMGKVIIFSSSLSDDTLHSELSAAVSTKKYLYFGLVFYILLILAVWNIVVF